MSLKFVNLHGHTQMSIFDAIGKVEQHADWMIQNAGEDSGALAITDHGNMNSIGSIASNQKKYEGQVKFIFGNEFYLTPSLAEWRALKIKTEEEKKETKKQKKKENNNDLVIEDAKESREKHFDPLRRRHHLVISAFNQKGLENLYRLTTLSYRDGFYRKPRIDFEMLQKYNEGLIANSACISGFPSYLSLRHEEEGDEKTYEMYDKEFFPLMEIFGKDRFFLELQFNKLPQQALVNRHLIEYSKRTGYNLIATADSHYPSPDMWRDREIYRLLGYQMLKKETDVSIVEKTIDELECELYLKNGDQIFAEYKKTFSHICDDEKLIEEAIERTYDIAHNFVEDVRPDGTIKLPKYFDVSTKSKKSIDILIELTIKELKNRGLTSKKYEDRLKTELKVIRELKVEDYFLALKQMIDEIKKHMLIGVARGSGGASLVCYLLNITFIDPVKHNLLFERFLSLSRKGFPDVDLDIEDKDKVFEILKEKYGENNVLAVSNYNGLQLRSLVKDISKLYDIPFQEVNVITKIMESEAKDKILAEINFDQKLYNFTFEKAKQYSPSFQGFLKKYPFLEKRIINLQGEIKAISCHAGGLIIIPNAEKHLPAIKIRGKFQSPITEGLKAQHLQQFGLIKYDFLGLATLRTIRRCIELILKKQGKDISIENVWNFYNKHLHPDVINSTDANIFKKIYWKGQFPSIFQFMEEPVQKFVQRARPESVNDISAITALWRPGPLGGGANKKYLKRKKQSEIEYEHPILKEVLENTKGLLLYQEQFMLLANKLAGFSLEEADTLRKLLVKPAKELGEELRQKRIEAGEKFVKGCVSSGLSQKRAEDLWFKEILSFISYGFNFSHALAYAFNSYHTAWLYTYHEKEWIKASLETDPDLEQTKKIVKSLGYKFKKIDINISSGYEWVINENKECVPPLSSVKNMGEKAIEEIENSRPFKDIYDMLWNENNKWRFSKFNIRAIGNLIKIEAFDSFDIVGKDKFFKNYNHMFQVVAIDVRKLKLKKGKENFEELTISLCDTEDWTPQEKCDIKIEILEEFDMDLLIPDSTKDLFRQKGIPSINSYSGKCPHWFVLDNYFIKTTKTGKKYILAKVLGEKNVKEIIFIWNYDERKHAPLISKNLYIAEEIKKTDRGFSTERNKIFRLKDEI